jgi:uncharacterized membrane protein YbhN (UPF0104 family)
MIVLACVGILFAPADLPWWIGASVWGSAALAFVGLACAPILGRWRRLSPERRRQLQLFWELMRSPRVLIEGSFMSILSQLLGVVILWCLAQGIGLDVPLAYCCVLVSLVSLLMLLPVNINGVGVREGGTVLLLAPLGVDESSALSLAFLWFAASVATSLLGGVVYLTGTSTTRTAGSAGRVEPVEQKS